MQAGVPSESYMAGPLLWVGYRFSISIKTILELRVENSVHDPALDLTICTSVWTQTHGHNPP